METKENSNAGLLWGLKRSLVEYVKGLDDGQISCSTGTIQRNGTTLFAFEFSGPGVHPLDALVLDFRGAVSISAYGGMLTVAFADPRIRLTGSTGVLSVQVAEERIDVADLEVPAPSALGDLVAWVDVPAALTADGAYLLGQQYFPGQQIDPLTCFAPCD